MEIRKPEELSAGKVGTSDTMFNMCPRTIFVAFLCIMHLLDHGGSRATDCAPSDGLCRCCEHHHVSWGTPMFERLSTQ